MTSNQVNDMNRNPEGKGGFQERPQDRSDGRWKKENSFSYWMNFFKQMKPNDFLEWEAKTPDDDKTVAMDLAYARVRKARNDLKEFECVANRTEGMPKQTIKNEFDDEVTEVKVEIKREMEKNDTKS